MIHSFQPDSAAAEGLFEQPELNSEAAVLIDARSGQILYDKNSRMPMHPASITKIATAIYAIHTGELQDVVTVSKKATQAEGTSVFLEEGEQLPLKKLIQGLVINSGNDAGVAIAEHISGSVEKFSEGMNEFFKREAGIQETFFENPHGLSSPNHLTSAHDMALITQYGIRDPEFLEIFGTPQLKWDGLTWDTTLINHHKLISQSPYEGILGGKNGYVSLAGFTLVTHAERDGLGLIAVTLKAPTDRQSYQDTMKLLDYGFQFYETGLIKEGTTFHDDEGYAYRNDEDIYYTKYKNEETRQEAAGGELVIKGENGRVLVSKALTSLSEELPSEEELLTNGEAQGEKQKQLSDSHFQNVMGISFAIVILLAGAFFFQIRKI
ncbi:D-alanyl-D-alanine carboxypeptidase [Bacillus lacus]|uniref:D-alanyl-D-alanine carboxypeptidase n=2 Tax=Metabacillus lacus TaxID=1983721 RepID=A0A7X2IYM2_9BACI|nr:D-alanyl-D-alanine carboxypeptidase [Metabacillus lacus]